MCEKQAIRLEDWMVGKLYIYENVLETSLTKYNLNAFKIVIMLIICI